MKHLKGSLSTTPLFFFNVQTTAKNSFVLTHAGPQTLFTWRKGRIRLERSVKHPENKSDAIHI